MNGNSAVADQSIILLEGGALGRSLLTPHSFPLLSPEHWDHCDTEELWEMTYNLDLAGNNKQIINIYGRLCSLQHYKIPTTIKIYYFSTPLYEVAVTVSLKPLIVQTR